MYDIIFSVGLILGIPTMTFFLSAGVEMILMLMSMKRKGYYETRKWKYTRVKKENV